jgi:hypothetical protein
MFVETLGKIVVIAAIAFVVLLAIALFLCFFIFRTKRIIFPNLVLFIISLLYEPLRRLLAFFRVDPNLIDRVSVEIRNMLNYQVFSDTALEDRVLLLPQCIRSTDCPAKLSSLDGIKCMGCMKCDIGKLSAMCKELGVRMYISPGGTFTKRILLYNRPKPKAVVGVACYPNLHEGMLNANLMGVAAQGVPLTTTGCVNTTVDIDEILNKCKMGRSG